MILESQTEISWYDIIKDIIIPTLSIVTTLIIGILIAILIKNRENKAKIKQLLIDDYMKYLETHKNSFFLEANQMKLSVLKDIYNSEEIFKNNSNRHLATGTIKENIDELKKELKNDKSDTDWSKFTYRFAFLIGKKKYWKDILPLENKITEEVISNKMRKEQQEDIIEKIKNNQNLLRNLNSSNLSEIEKAIDLIHMTSYRGYNVFHLSLFQSYNNKVADAIMKR